MWLIRLPDALSKNGYQPLSSWFPFWQHLWVVVFKGMGHTISMARQYGMEKTVLWVKQWELWFPFGHLWRALCVRIVN